MAPVLCVFFPPSFSQSLLSLNLSPSVCLSMTLSLSLSPTHTHTLMGKRHSLSSVPCTQLHLFHSHKSFLCVLHSLSLHHTCSPTLSHWPPQCHPTTDDPSQQTDSHSQPLTQRYILSRCVTQVLPRSHKQTVLNTKSPTVPQSRGLSKCHTVSRNLSLTVTHHQ